MGHPVTTSEQLLQEIRDSLARIEGLLQRGQATTIKSAAAPAVQGTKPPVETPPGATSARRRRSSSTTSR